MKMKYTILLAVMLLLACSFSFATIPTIRSGAPTEGAVLYDGDLSLVINTTGIPNFKNMTTNVYRNGVLVQTNLSGVQQLTLAVPLVYTKGHFSTYIINISARNATDTWYASPLTFQTIDPALNPTLLTGLAGVGDVFGAFITNLIVGLLPAIIVIAILGLVVLAIFLVGGWIEGSLKKFGK